MLTKRIIPCLDVKGGRVVKGTSFVQLKDAGDPVELADFYYREGADELVFLDITATNEDETLWLRRGAHFGESIYAADGGRWYQELLKISGRC